MYRIAPLLLLVCPWCAWAQFEVPNPPHISAIHSPNSTIELRWGKSKKNLRRAELLPSEPFVLTSHVNDLVEVTYPDETIVRQGPNTTVYYLPASNSVTVVAGSVLAKIPEKTEVIFRVPEVKGTDCILLTTVSKDGIKTFSLAGEFDFHGTHVKEGEMYFQNALPDLQGPFLIDLAEVIASSPLAIEFPKSPWIKASMEKSLKKQKWLKDMGMVESSHTALHGSSPQVQWDKPLPPPHKKRKSVDDED